MAASSFLLKPESESMASRAREAIVGLCPVLCLGAAAGKQASVLGEIAYRALVCSPLRVARVVRHIYPYWVNPLI